MVLTWWMLALAVAVVGFFAGPYVVDAYYWWKHARPFQPGWLSERKRKKAQRARRVPKK